MLKITALWLLCSGAPFMPSVPPGATPPAETCTQANAVQTFQAQLSDRACLVYRLGNEIERQSFMARTFHIIPEDDQHIVVVCP